MATSIRALRSNSRQWDGHIKAYVDDCLEGEDGPHGMQRMMEIQPKNTHQRLPMIFGSKHEVELVEQYYDGLNPYHERPQLFRNRTLLRN